MSERKRTRSDIESSSLAFRTVKPSLEDKVHRTSARGEREDSVITIKRGGPQQNLDLAILSAHGREVGGR
eukprot:935136-Heterocapsa_arctica.AAC.1